MFDLLSTAELTASAAILVFFLSATLSMTARQRVLVAAGFVVWFGLVLTLGATGALSGGGAIGTPGLGLVILIPFAVLSVLVLSTMRGRELIQRTSLPAMVGIHAVRVLGLSFVLLYAAKRLPAPFAPTAGWGDVTVGLLAIPLALMLLRNEKAVPRGWIVAWNVLGLTDLTVAIMLGATSAPGPIQLFHGEPTSAIMTSLPWILIPCFLVPSLAFVHMCTFYRLRMLSPVKSSVKPASVRVVASGS